MFWGLPTARNLWRKSLMKYGLWPEINHRNLDGIYAEIKSLTKILDQNALEFLASGKGVIMDRLRLDIITKIFRRIFNENPCSPCVPWIFFVA